MSDKCNYGAVALEMTSIAVAIILGFAVSNWDERRREASRADAAVERISRELEANADAIRLGSSTGHSWQEAGWDGARGCEAEQERRGDGAGAGGTIRRGSRESSRCRNGPQGCADGRGEAGGEAPAGRPDSGASEIEVVGRGLGELEGTDAKRWSGRGSAGSKAGV